MPELLVASHVKPWSKCENQHEKISPNNGLLLCSIHDRLFDRGFMTFDENTLEIKLAEAVNLPSEQMKLLKGKIEVYNEVEFKKYLNFHQEIVFRDYYNK